MEIDPESGDLVLFPGWLQHTHTSSTCGEEGPSVTFFFDVTGEWEETANTSVDITMRLEE